MRFRVLGPLEVRGGSGWERVNPPKARLLLACLLVRAGEIISMDRIVFELWGDGPPKTASTQVHGYVLRLRRQLDDCAALTTADPGYRLVLDDGDTDALVFRTTVADGQRAYQAGQPDQAAELINKALRLWRGAAFADVSQTSLIAGEVDRLGVERLAAVEARIDADIARFRHAEVVGELWRLVAEYPLRERLWRRLMVALWHGERPAEALHAYDRLRQVLREELGAEPSASLQELHQRLLRGDEPQRVEQPVCQLPADIPDFTGRLGALDTVATAFANRSPETPPPVVVVSGAPGVGKSALALHAARRAASAYPNGQLYLDLAGTSQEPRDPEVLLAEVLHALGVTGSAVPNGPHARAALYRSLLAGRKVLLLLDDAADVAQVRWLQPPNGNSAVIVTSRGHLTELPGARHLELDVLDENEAHQLFSRMLGDRVNAEPGDAAAILRACGYLPLAIRIAAGKLLARPAWSLGVLRERLADSAGRLRELQVRELGVRASVELSMRLLPGAAVHAFRLLSLLGPHTVPGWVLGPLTDRECADGELDLLVDANLLRSAQAEGEPRYRMHDLLRVYALDGAAEIPHGDRRDAVARLLATWLDLTAQAVDRLPPSIFRPPTGIAPRRGLPERVVRRLVADPLRWFGAERQTLLGAIELAVEWRLPDLAWELATAAVPYYDHRSLFDDWRRGHELALRAVRAADDRRGEAFLLRGLAQVGIYRDEYDTARSNLARARELFHAMDDKLGEGLATAGLGTVDRVLGRYDSALAQVAVARELVIAAGDRHLEAHLRNVTAVSLVGLGRLAEAESWFTGALELCRELGDTHREAVVLRELSQLHQRRGDIAEGQACLEHALAGFTALADDRCAAYTLLKAGGTYESADARKAALTRAADIFLRNGTRMEQAKCWQQLGELAVAEHDMAEARRCLTRTAELWRSIGADEQATAVADQLQAHERDFRAAERVSYREQNGP